MLKGRYVSLKVRRQTFKGVSSVVLYISEVTKKIRDKVLLM